MGPKNHNNQNGADFLGDLSDASLFWLGDECLVGVPNQS